MQYYSTEHQAADASLAKAVVQGLAEDRGLYMPERIPAFSADWIRSLPERSFVEIGQEVAAAFFGEDVPRAELDRIVAETLSFDCPAVPVEEGDNYSSRDPHRLSLKFNVPYGTDLDQLRDILLELVKDQPKILNAETPGAKNPKVYLGELQDSSIQIKLRVWLLAKDYKKVEHWLNERIYKELPKHGIYFPFPQLDVHMKPGRED